MARPAILKIDIVSDFNNKGVNAAEKGLEDYAETAKRVSAVAVAAIGAGGYKAAQAASDQNEALNKVNVVYGESAAEIAKWADGAAKGFGLSKTAALDAAGSMGTFFTQIGFTNKESVNMSTSLVELGSDLASFHNLAGGAAEATDMMSSAFRGEFDSIQRVIPTLNAAAVQNRALEMTGKDSAAALTDAEKAAATYQLILEGAGPAVGDFGRTSDSMANAQRTLKATLDDTAAAIGQAVVPVIEALLPLLVSAAEWVAENSDIVTTLAAVLGGLGAAILAVNAAMGVYNGIMTAGKAVTAAWTAAGKAATAMSKAWTVVQKALNIALKANPIGLIVTAIGLLVTALVTAYQKSDTFRAIVDKLWQLLKNTVVAAFNAVSTAIEKVVGWIKSAWRWVQKLIDKFRSFRPPSWVPGFGRSSLTVAPGVPRASRAPAGGQTINVTISGAIDPVGTAEAIRRVLRQQDRRVGRPVAPVWAAGAGS